MDNKKSPEQIEAEVKEKFSNRGFTEVEIQIAVKNEISIQKVNAFAATVIEECRKEGFTYVEMDMIQTKIKFAIERQLADKIDAIRRQAF